ncbi:MAG: peptidylprolyl isomerase [Cellvibrionales bacterium]|nr:peptidylprolyl isomerase [Cellvibrionales bacterium]
MKIEKNTVVRFHYDLYDQADGKKIETSKEGDPVAFLFGHNNVIKGLEEAMVDKNAGDAFDVEVPPYKGYGLRHDNSTQRVPLKHLVIDKKAKLKPGMVVNIQTDRGQKQATVIKAGKFNVDVDTNHPFAGKMLKFAVEVIDVREATAEEVAHGHAHGVGGHQH